VIHFTTWKRKIGIDRRQLGVCFRGNKKAGKWDLPFPEQFGLNLLKKELVREKK
jgi:hypothetical protein